MYPIESNHSHEAEPSANRACVRSCMPSLYRTDKHMQAGELTIGLRDASEANSHAYAREGKPFIVLRIIRRNTGCTAWPIRSPVSGRNPE